MDEVASFLLYSEQHAFGIMTLDLSGNVIYANRKVKTIYPITERSAIPAHTNLYSITRLCLEQRQGIAGEWFHEPMPEQEHSHFVLYAYPMIENGSMSMLTVILCQSGSLYQYVEGKSSEERLNLIGDMGAGAANVVLNPLAVIKGTAQLMENSLRSVLFAASGTTHPLIQKCETYFQTIYEQVRAIDGHLHRFLLLGKPSAMKLATISILPLLQRLIPVVQLEAIDRRIKLVCEYPELNGQVVGHEPYLLEALMALVNNAFEATMQGGAVTIRTVIAERFVHFHILDNGTGISPELLAEVKKPFVTTKDEALGLGLSYCEAVVQKMGGTLDISPRTRGTEAHIQIPRMDFK